MTGNLPEGLSEYSAPIELSWKEMLGPVRLRTDLDPTVINHPGLMWMTIEDGREICPQRQFEVSDDGGLQLKPIVADAWAFFRLFDDQRGADNMTTMLRFVAPPRGGGRTLFDMLDDVAVPDTDKFNLIAERLEALLYAANFEGLEIVDPRRMIGGAALGEGD